MKPASFSYERPATLEAALACLASRGDETKIIAGGQSLAPMMNMRLAQPAHLVDINGLEELNAVTLEGDRLLIGALVCHADLVRHPLVRMHCPMLAHAAETIGHYAIRQRGTIGGSLAHADPAAQLPLVAVTLDANCEIASSRRQRIVDAREFFQSMFTTVLQTDEILLRVRFPVSVPNTGWGFRLFTRRAGDFALVAVAVSLGRSGDMIDDVRIAVGGAGPVPARLDHVLLGEDIEPNARWAARTAKRVAEAADIEEQERTSVDYRRDLVAVLAEDALNDALRRSDA